MRKAESLMCACALVGASDFNAEHFKEMDRDAAFDFVIAVDGGLAHLDSIGRKADLALGDFDSLGYTPKNIRAAKFSSHKDASDMELALKRTKSMHQSDLYIYGGLGGRLDHTLANLQTCALYSEQGLSITMIGNTEAVSFITGPDTLEIPALEEGTVSVFSMSDKAHGVFERGLVYELDDATLTNRTSLGLSNEFTGEAAMIGVEKGTLAVFTPL